MLPRYQVAVSHELQELKSDTNTLIQDDQVEVICKIARARSTDLLTSLLSEGLSINDEMVNQAIRRLASQAETTAVTFLFSHGADLNEALSEAAKNNQIDLVNYIIYFRKKCVEDSVKAGAGVDAAENLLKESIKVAVEGAAEGGHKKLVINLINEGGNKQLALLVAMKNENMELENLLLAAGADRFQLLTHLASKSSQDEACLAMIRKFLVKEPSLKPWALKGAAAGQSLELMEELIADGVSINYAVRSTASAGLYELTGELIGRKASLVFAAAGAHEGKQLETEEQVFNFLKAMPTEFRNGFISEISPVFANKRKLTAIPLFSLLALAIKADDMDKFAKEYKATPKQSLACHKSTDVYSLFTICISNKYLTSTACFIVAAYLSPDLPNTGETRGLLQALWLNMKKDYVTLGLKNYYSTSGLFAFTRDIRAWNLAEKCGKAGSERKLDESIEEEIMNLTKKDYEYGEFLKRFL